MDIKQAQEIYEGFTNLIKSKFQMTSIELEEMSEKRTDICKQCVERDSVMDTCDKCGCFLPAKTFSPSSECPIGNWKQIQ